MADSKPRRPSILAKRTHVHAQKHAAAFPNDIPASPRILDSLIAGISYAGLATFVYSHYRKFSPWEIASLSLGSIFASLSLYDLGRQNGMIQGASFALLRKKKSNGGDAEEDWRGEFTGMEFEELKVAEKIAWLRKEEGMIREKQQEEQLRCGQAYIKKEEAYIAYERLGGYGGTDWKRYNQADEECQEMYHQYERQEKRLRKIREEIDELNEQI